MIKSLAFQARARTIDHLGREQIADCPTAVSELWKNAYDAYARNVSLAIYSGNTAIATITDDGHGMNFEEFTAKWLVVGTESKADQNETPEADRDGLPFRTKQGQKGIGRLSSASLGPLLLVVSKRKLDPFVVALIDWRIFENPYLVLSDIEIPVAEFEKKEELLPILPILFDRLMDNIWCKNTSDKGGRKQRVEAAWDLFSRQEIAEGRPETTQDRIARTVIETAFDERHFSEWPLWKGQKTQGTIMAISDIQYDLIAQIPQNGSELDSVQLQARERLFQTLSNFTDPFLTDNDRMAGYGAIEFSTRVTVLNESLRRSVIDESVPFDVYNLLELEHVVDGEFDELGVFRGRIKAFGDWLQEEVVIRPGGDVPIRKDTLVGPFRFRIGTFEQGFDLTSHGEESFRTIEDKAALYGGLLVFRNGLRVLPYGREGNDFFGVEMRRSKHAGREFWSLRRLFGRVAIRKENCPNLRDKAGREGLIDNRAAKVFRDLIVNILKVTARQYFGSNAEMRKTIIPNRKENFRRQKALEARNKQRSQGRREFKNNLEKYGPITSALLAEVEGLADRVREGGLGDVAEVILMRGSLQGLKERYQEISLGEAPRNLGTMEEAYVAFRKQFRSIKGYIDSVAGTLDNALDVLKPRSAKEILSSQLSANAAFLNRRLRAWAQEAKGLLGSEVDRISSLQSERSKAYQTQMQAIIDEVERGEITLRCASERLEIGKEQEDEANSDLFIPYISALNSLKASIDLAGLASFSQDQADELREEVDRLHGLAQLGITVEIIGHEVEGLEQAITAGLKGFPDKIKETPEFQAVRDGHEALVERLRFLSPLKLSGPKTRIKLTGKIILDYINKFFHGELEKQNIELVATSEFIRFSIFEQPARIFPVFINLVNNAGYWVNHSENGPKKILLDVNSEKVLIADTGPGVDEEDLKELFKLFFTRKVRGGRGVGLYLCRANLAAGGHTIEYLSQGQGLLPGANFAIDFKGASFE